MNMTAKCFGDHRTLALGLPMSLIIHLLSPRSVSHRRLADIGVIYRRSIK